VHGAKVGRRGLVRQGGTFCRGAAGGTMRAWCVVTRQTNETREGPVRLAHVVLDPREPVPPRQAPKHRVAGPTWHRETGLRERGITSLRVGVSRSAGSKHAGRNMK
jgi:hypothetical protein